MLQKGETHACNNDGADLKLIYQENSDNDSTVQVYKLKGTSYIQIVDAKLTDTFQVGNVATTEMCKNILCAQYGRYLIRYATGQFQVCIKVEIMLTGGYRLSIQFGRMKKLKFSFTAGTSMILEQFESGEWRSGVAKWLNDELKEYSLIDPISVCDSMEQWLKNHTASAT